MQLNQKNHVDHVESQEDFLNENGQQISQPWLERCPWLEVA